MYIRRAISFILAVLLLITAVSCSSSIPSGSGGGSRESKGLEDGGSKELSMYYMDYDTTAKNAIDKFNETHKDVQIKAKSLLSYPADNLRSKLSYEFINGKGPDIILCEQDTLPNLSVFFGKGCFYDLNVLMDNDKSFKKKDYFQKLFDYGMYNGKRYVLPLSFKIDAMFTTKDILDKSGAGIDGTNATFDVFSEAA